MAPGRALLSVCILFFMLLSAVHAKDAAPLAEDPQLEERVTNLSTELRCLVCQNQTIADSHAPLAIDLKNQIRDQLKAGNSDDQVRDYMVKRYGDFVLYNPPLKATTSFLWFGPFLLIIAGFIGLFYTLKKRNRIMAAAGAHAEIDEAGK
jgi:cytochrome c-type biogenesis protein CcmH